MSIYEEKNKRVPVEELMSTPYESISQQLDTYVDIESSVVYLAGDIDERTLVDLIIRIRAILSSRTAATKDYPINLIINSNGGDVYEMLGIVDYIESLSVPVNTICRGRAFSAAAVILACGTGTRMASKRSCVMFHEAISFADGIKMSDMTAYINNLKSLEDDVCNMLASKSNKDANWWKQQQRTDLFLSADQLKQYGIIDEII
jgi:ATP-dependent Clp protease protease subunit